MHFGIIQLAKTLFLLKQTSLCTSSLINQSFDGETKVSVCFPVLSDMNDLK